MTDTVEARRMLELAEHAANAGDLASADELLRKVAHVQEAELGPLHYELANTLTNLAIVAEKAGRIGDAETFYRRAAAIAAAALPADHPMVVASRQNLEDFCHASGLATETATVLTPTTQDTELGLGAFAPESTDSTEDEGTGHEAAGRTDKSAVEAAPGRDGPPIPPKTAADKRSGAPAVDPDVIGRRTAPVPPGGQAVQPRGSTLLWIVYTAVAVATAVSLLLWQMSGDSSPTSTPAPAAPSASATTPAAPQGSAAPPRTTAAPEAASATARTAPAPSANPPAGTAPTAADPPREATLAPSATSSDGVSLASVELCRSFSTTGGAWRCDPADDSVSPGAVVLFTRVKAPRNTTVVHHWYRGGTQQLAAKLSIRANPSEGYRTYSRRTVGSGEEWRVEVRTASGELLHERRFVVQ